MGRKRVSELEASLMPQNADARPWRAEIAASLRSLIGLEEVLIFGGLGLLLVGLAMVWLPLAPVVGGILLMAFGLLVLWRKQ